MPKGHVKRYERNSGFGFIQTETGQELFVHHTALKGREFLLTGQQVEFEVVPGDRGPRAVNVRVTEEVPPKKKNHPDWRGHRGGAPRFEGQERVLPGGAGRSRRQRPTIARGERLGPPVDPGDAESEEMETQNAEPAGRSQEAAALDAPGSVD